MALQTHLAGPAERVEKVHVVLLVPVTIHLEMVSSLQRIPSAVLQSVTVKVLLYLTVVIVEGFINIFVLCPV